MAAATLRRAGMTAPAWGVANARRTARVVEVDVPIEGLPAVLEGFTIAQVSDVHVGPTIGHGYVASIVGAVNRLEAGAVAVPVSRNAAGPAAGSASIRPDDAPCPTMPACPDLVLFDLDHTLLDGDSNQLWLGWLVERGAVPATRLAQQADHYARYEAGMLDIDAYLAFHLSMLVERSVADWRPLRDAFVAERIAPRIGPAAQAAVAHHRARGDTLAVVTATHDFLAEGIVALLGAPPLVATRCQVSGGRFTGRVDGVPCFAHAKPGCVRDWLAAAGRRWEDFGTVRFYSDSANDLPLLEAVTHPVVVDPDPRLAAIAAERGWPSQSWARNAGG